MNRPRFRVLVSLVSAVAMSLVFAGSMAPDRWPPHWQVNGNGITGTLEISIGEGGALTGRLLGEAIEGYVSGRHMVIRRTGTDEDRSEVWDGWLGQPDADSIDPIVAGTITVFEGERTHVYPWFGTLATATSVPDAVTPAADTAAAAVQPTPTGGRLSGYWSAAEGKMEILQDGKMLTVILPDGSSISGRMTGVDTLIVGLRNGCCNGKLAGANAIDWNDGSRWLRAD